MLQGILNSSNRSLKRKKDGTAVPPKSLSGRIPEIDEVAQRALNELCAELGLRWGAF
jgi:hypothetical protein